MRNAASDIRTRAERGIDPHVPVASDALTEVVKNFIELHAKKNRSWQETERIFYRYVLPEWRGKQMRDIDQDYVTALLDSITSSFRQVGRPFRRWI
jgi:hypothetical protein